ncbi:hypothetical protein VTL71DRAFT_4303 [Oculimacula yallundae]|uniref:Uncharacterized protein n=1 Tax=Oculimacula yallundae TaxID=86028 RepID=A0ABR4C6M2_9HELO
MTSLAGTVFPKGNGLATAVSLISNQQLSSSSTPTSPSCFITITIFTFLSLSDRQRQRYVLSLILCRAHHIGLPHHSPVSRKRSFVQDTSTAPSRNETETHQSSQLLPTEQRIRGSEQQTARDDPRRSGAIRTKERQQPPVDTKSNSILISLFASLSSTYLSALITSPSSRPSQYPSLLTSRRDRSSRPVSLNSPSFLLPSCTASLLSSSRHSTRTSSPRSPTPARFLSKTPGVHNEQTLQYNPNLFSNSFPTTSPS